MTTKYVTYYRVSTKKQGDSGLGLEAQQRDVALYLGNYSDRPYEVLAEFKEIESGSNSDRPFLNEAINLCKKEKATLLVAKLDRLGRRVSFIASLMEDKALDIKIATMPSADKFQLHIYAALAEQERDFISLRTKAALAEKKAAGVMLGGLRPNTERSNKVRAEKAKNEAEKLRGLVIPLVTEGKSLRQIASVLNDAQIKTSRGNQYSAVTVSRLLNRLNIKRDH